MSTVIVGAGISGLACACWLKQLQPGHQVRVLEQAVHVGGKIRTRRLGEFLLEAGPECFANSDAAILQMCRALGLRADLHPVRQGQRLLLLEAGRLHSLPEELQMGLLPQPWAALVNPSLSLPGRLRSALQGMVGQEPVDPGEGLSQMVQRRLKSDGDKCLSSPLSAGLLATAQTSTPDFPHLAIYRQEGEPAFLTLEGGMQRLVDSLAAELGSTVVCQQTVERVHRQDSGGWLVCGPEGRSWACRNLVVATGAAESARLLVPICAGLVAPAPLVSGACIYLEFSRSHVDLPADSYGCVTPDLADRPLVACSWQLLPDVVLVRAYLRDSEFASVERASAGELVQAALAELRRPLGLSGLPRMTHVERYVRAFPDYRVADFCKIEETERLRRSFAGLYWSGPAFGVAGVPQCIHHAREVAKDILLREESDHENL